MFIDDLKNQTIRYDRKLIVDYKDVMLVIDALEEIRQESRLHICSDMKMGCCGWNDEPSKWFIAFDVTNNQWKRLIEKLGCVDRNIILKKDNRLYLV